MEDGLGLRFGAGLSAHDGKASTNGTTSNVTDETETDNNDNNIDNSNEEEEAWEEEELPVISIELERLVGFKPSSQEEIDSIKKQLLEAMWMRYKSSTSQPNNNNTTSGIETKENKEDKTREEAEEDEEKEPPPDFDDQVKELLDSRVARFGSTQSQYIQEETTTTTIQDESNNIDEKTRLNNNNNGKSNPGPFLEIMYPSRVLPPNTSDDERTLLEDTAKLWSDIRSLAYALEEEDDGDGEGESQDDETRNFWYRLSDHLEHTGRLLSWKHSMALELKDLLYRESLHKNHQLWVKEQRTAKLEQLYQVRETLFHRKEVAKVDFDKLSLQKETAIRRDMLLYDYSFKRKKAGSSCDSSLFGGGGMSFPEEFELMGLLPKDSQLYEEEDWGGTLDDEDDFDYYNSDYSSSSDDGYSDDEDDLSGFSGDEEGGGDDQAIDSLPPPMPEKTTNTEHISGDDDDDASPRVATIPAAQELPTTTTIDQGEESSAAILLPTTSVPRPFLRRNKARRKKKARAQRKKELAEAKRKEEQKLRKEHEAKMEAKHNTNELVLAQTLLEALEKKLVDVEELLENLQEEEWAAEEEEEAENHQPQQQQEEEPAASRPSDDDKNEPLSLLDQILAMILGALPMEPGSKDKERHFQYVKEEHEFIVRGWKEYFGRLPPAHVPGQTNPTSTTIESFEEEAANHEDDADDNDDDDEDKDSSAKTERKPTIGFRVPPTTVHKLTRITSKQQTRNSSSATTTPLAAETAPVATPQEQRLALGIVDNDEGDWEEEDDDDDE